jgi:hypothetical protein
LKQVRSLFLDDLHAEFETAKREKKRLGEFHRKIAKLTFLDPACGCGNFLVVTYRELRLLEIEILRILHGDQTVLDIHHFSLVDVDAMYGIEIKEFPVRVAEVALWLMDHQMNQRLSEAFGQYFVRLPLKKSATIKNANALRINWREVLPPEKCSFVMGNPPFVGKHLMTREQGEDTEIVWGDLKGSGFLDYVTCWYKRAAEYIQGTAIPVGFVSTNSITQGEQVGVLWNELFTKYHIKIHFAYRTFAWESEARGKAHVHVVIIGFGGHDVGRKRIFEVGKSGQVTAEDATNIGPYLISSNDIALPIRCIPICRAPLIVNGNKPADGGFLIVEDDKKAEFLSENPEIAPWLRAFVSADEFINGRYRWVLWLIDAPPSILRECPGVLERLEGVRAFRKKSNKKSTRDKAATPAIFDQIRQPTSRYLLIPRHSSESRKYIPFGYFNPDVIIADSCTAIPNASLYHFGVLSSLMHMAWVARVCGRIKSDYRYSNKLVYNNFPWPETPTDKQKAGVEANAKAVLDARTSHTTSCLADMYDPLIMPVNLAKAHANLDRAVDACYRAKPFESDRERVEFLFILYEKLVAPLTAKVKKPRQRKKPD